MSAAYHFKTQHPAIREWEQRFALRLAQMDILFGCLKLLAVDHIDDRELNKAYGDLLVWYRSLKDTRVDYMVADLKCDIWELRNRETGNLAIETGTTYPDGTHVPRNLDMMVWHWRALDDTVYLYVPSRLDLTGKPTIDTVNKDKTGQELYRSHNALYPAAQLCVPRITGFFGQSWAGETTRLKEETKDWA